MFAWIFRWPRHAAICGAVALALLAYGAWSTWAIMTVKPQPTVDYVAKLNELTLEGQPEGEDAWPVYREIIVDDLAVEDSRKHGPLYKHLRDVSRSVIWSGAWDHPGHNAIKADIVRIYPVLEKLDRAADSASLAIPLTARLSPPSDLTTNSALTPTWKLHFTEHISPIRALASANVAALRAAFESGDEQEVMRRLTTGLRITEHLMLQRTIIAHLTAPSVSGLLMQELSHQILEKSLSPELSRSIADAIGHSVDRMQATQTRWIAGESMMRRDWTQWMYAPAWPGTSVAVITKLPGALTTSIWVYRPIGNLSGLFLPNREDALGAIDQYESLLRRAADAAPLHHRELESEFWDTIHNVPPFASELWVVLDGVMKGASRQISTAHGVRLMALLEIHHESTGEWPALLTEAVSDELARDPVSGLPFGYRHLVGDESGRPYEVRIPWTRDNEVGGVVSLARGPFIDLDRTKRSTQ